MKKPISILLLSLMFLQSIVPAFASTQKVVDARLVEGLVPYTDYAVNGGAERNKAGWVVSGTSSALTDLAIDTTNKYEGNAGFAWTPANADNLLSNTAVTIVANQGLSGQNCAATVFTKTAVGTHALEAFDGTSVLASVTIPISTTFVPVTLNWPCSSSGTQRVRFNAGGSTTVLYFDSLHWGDARGINITAVGGVTTDWVSYTPTGNFSTNVTYKGQWRRVGDSMEVDVNVTFSGATDTAVFAVNLPSGKIIDVSKIAANSASPKNSVVGSCKYFNNGFGGDGYSPGNAAVESTTQLSCITLSSGNLNGGTTISNALPVTIDSTVVIDVHATVPISGWGGNSVAYQALAGGLNAGEESITAATSCPVGTIAENGASLLRSDYPALFAAIGTTYGSADGTHFNVPDARGVFERGAGTNGTITASNGSAMTGTQGTNQNDMMQGHYHSLNDPGHNHQEQGDSTFNLTIGSNPAIRALSDAGPSQAENQRTVSSTTGITITSASSDGSNGTPRTGAETRPASISHLHCIRYIAATPAPVLLGVGDRQTVIGTPSTSSGTVTSATFAVLTNTPTVTIVPTKTKQYKIFTTFPVTANTNNATCDFTVNNSVGSATLVYKGNNSFTVTTTPGNYFPNYIFAIYTLTAGITYTFNVFALCDSGAQTTAVFARPSAGTSLIVEEFN